MDKEVVALFDLDGTLTRRDTLPLYIRHATGAIGLLCALISNLPAMTILACAGWKSVWGIDAASTKERLLKRCFAGKTPEQVAHESEQFAEKIEEVKSDAVVNVMKKHLTEGHRVAIVSASVDVWVAPWARRYGVNEVIATQLEISDEHYTGHFAGNNCTGEEKVRRISAIFPRDKYHIVAYGNSSGDYPMLRYAHEAYMCSNETITPFR